MAAAATVAAAAPELVMRTGAADMEEEEGPLVRTQGFFFSRISFGRLRVRKTWAGFSYKVGSPDAIRDILHSPPWART